MNSYIPKPYSPEILITEIANVLKLDLTQDNQKKSIHTLESNKSVTNLDYLTSFCEGDLHRIKKYTRMFVSSAPIFIEKLIVALEDKDYVTIANQVHSFKTKWIMMGMNSTKDLALQLEVLARAGVNEDLITKLTLSLIDIINQALVELDS